MTGRPPAASPIAHPPTPLELQTYTKNVILLPSAQKKSRLKMNADGNVGGNVGGVAGNNDGSDRQQGVEICWNVLFLLL